MADALAAIKLTLFAALDDISLNVRQGELHDHTGLHTIFVTHDKGEALELADRVAILNRGRIEQLGSPAETYDQPASPLVYSFVGAVNRLPGEWRDGRLRVAGLDLAAPGAAVGQGALELYVRPEHLQLTETREGWPAMVLSSQRSAPRQRLWARLHTGDTEVEIELPASADALAHAAGSEVRLAATRFGVFSA